MRYLILFILLTLGAEATVTAQDAGPDDPNVPWVLQQWRERQDGVRTMKASLMVSQKIPKHALTIAKQQPTDPTRWPPYDLDHGWREELSIDGVKMRFFSDRPAVMADGQIIPQSRTCTFDGETAKSFQDVPGTSPGLGGIREDDVIVEARKPTLRPLIWSMRPLDSKIAGFEAENMRLLDERPLHEGRSCAVLEIAVPGNRVEHFWIDPHRNCAIVRAYWKRNAKVGFDMTITYTKDSDETWLPSRWTSIAFDTKGGVTDQVDVVVSSIEVNKPIENAEFTLTFPPKSMIVDEKAKQITLTDEDSKTVRVSTFGESRPRDVESNSAIWYFVAALIAIVMAFLFWRRNRRFQLFTKETNK